MTTIDAASGLFGPARPEDIFLAMVAPGGAGGADRQKHVRLGEAKNLDRLAETLAFFIASFNVCHLGTSVLDQY
jgi:hypothetical protein